jgi:hypothetical protein
MFTLSVSVSSLRQVRTWWSRLNLEKLVVVCAGVLAVLATVYAYTNDLIVLYGDAESHLNIAKRVVHSLTPGFAQLGGIWLPLPHLLLLPFVYFDSLWRSGLAGSIVSGVSFVITVLYTYKLLLLLTANRTASFLQQFW